MAGTALWELYCSRACRAQRHALPEEPPPLPADMAPAPAPPKNMRALGQGLMAGAFGVAAPSKNPCPWCGGKVPPSAGPVPRKYCSTRCRSSALGKASRDRAAAARRDERKTPRPCARPGCGATFLPPARGAPKKYCSRACVERMSYEKRTKETA